jgi:hypothetical protein
MLLRNIGIEKSMMANMSAIRGTSIKASSTMAAPCCDVRCSFDGFLYMHGWLIGGTGGSVEEIDRV